jgi:hypothetical protein
MNPEPTKPVDPKKCDGSRTDSLLEAVGTDIAARTVLTTETIVVTHGGQSTIASAFSQEDFFIGQDQEVPC